MTSYQPAPLWRVVLLRQVARRPSPDWEAPWPWVTVPYGLRERVRVWREIKKDAAENRRKSILLTILVLAVAATLALASAACCAVRAPRPAPVARETVVVSMLRSVEWQGVPCYATTSIGATDRVAQRIDFEAALDDDQALEENVAAHELGHALGLEHTTVAFTWMCPVHRRGEPVIPDPTPAEAALAAKHATWYAIEPDASASPALVASLRWACERWNRALGRAEFVVAKE